MELQLLERGALADALLASCYLAVPGAGGGPHADAQPRPYSWSCTSPVQVPPPEGRRRRTAARRCTRWGRCLCAVAGWVARRPNLLRRRLGGALASPLWLSGRPQLLPCV
jgi:hypothetical protein